MTLKKFTYFFPDKPKLVQINQPLFKRINKDENWVAQRKFNDQRLELHFLNGEFSFWNRHYKRLSYQPNKEMTEALENLASKIKGYWIFDGGLRHNKVKGISHKIVLWDVFVANGEILSKATYQERFKLLQSLFQAQKLTGDNHILAPAQIMQGDFSELFKFVIKNEEIEGLVLKNKTGKLTLGRTRSHEVSWMFKVRKATGRHKF